MKRTIVAILTLTSAILISSCSSKGLSEEAKKSITDFQAEWKASGDMLTAWGNTMTTKFADMKKMETETDAMVKGAKIPAANTAAVDSLTKVCMSLEGKRTEIQTAYNAAVKQFEADGKAFTEWTAKAMKGDVDAAGITKGLDEYKAKLTACKADMESWNTMLADTEKMCMETCNSLHDAAMPKM